MIDSEHRIYDGNHQSYMTAEYIFRFMNVGETFTIGDLVGNVGFRSKEAKGTLLGINRALKELLAVTSGRSNVIVVSTDPTKEVQYKFIDNERPILLARSKSAPITVALNTKYFETLYSKENKYAPSLSLIEKLQNTITENKYSTVVQPEKDMSSVSFEQQIRQMTDSQRLEAIIIITKVIDEARADAVSVLELMK